MNSAGSIQVDPNGVIRITLGWTLVVSMAAICLTLISESPVLSILSGILSFSSLFIALSGHSVRIQKKLRLPLDNKSTTETESQLPTNLPRLRHGHLKDKGVPRKQGANARLITQAKNLELARDWEGAAEAFQQAGLFEEAGRVRQLHLEKEDERIVLNIDRIGDTVLNDSVLLSEADNQERNAD